jgi:acetolactate synthase regulatory subunit
MNSFASIYIPRMSIYHTEESVRHIFDYFMVGNVTHVDFTPINKKPGFGEDVDSVVKSAFIHFSTTTNVGFWDVIESNQVYRMQVTRGEYWLCLKNKNPVKRTLMNIHQVVDSGRHLESLVEQQAEKIYSLESQVIRLQTVVTQLIGGLYCQSTQRNSIVEMLNQLTGQVDEDYIIAAERDTNEWENWPTTRQGDSCEKRLETIEHILGVKNGKQESILIEDDTSTINSELIADNTWKDNYSNIEKSVDEDELSERRRLIMEEKFADKSFREDRWLRRSGRR